MKNIVFKDVKNIVNKPSFSWKVNTFYDLLKGAQ